jgi:hypothetical protein
MRAKSMKIPADAFIARSKLTHYLLVPKPKNDKSGFLAQVGFTQRNPDVLEAALRYLLTEYEAVSDRVNEYGTFYQVRGWLRGPHGMLAVVTIWLRQNVDGIYQFITLKPER